MFKSKLNYTHLLGLLVLKPDYKENSGVILYWLLFPK